MFGIFSKKQKLREREAEFVTKIELIKNESAERIAVLERALERKKIELDMLKAEKNNISTEQKIRAKQEDIIEKNLKDMKRENDFLKEKIADMRSKSIFNPLPIDSHQYKIPLERYFSSAKFEGIVKGLKAVGREHVCEINHEDLLRFELDKNIDELKKHYRKFLDGYLDLDTKILATKGERIGKIYNKNRKFVAFAHENNLEFMDDIRDFNFYKLIENDFKSEMIEELVSKNEEYHKRYYR